MAEFYTYDLSGVFEMRDPTGADIGGASDVTGTLSIDMATGSGTATFSTQTPFFGTIWIAHDITIQMTGEDTMTVDMLFDWGTNLDIEVTVDMGVAFNADGSATFTTLDTDGDGILGSPMDNGPFTGFNIGFDFALTNGSVVVQIIATDEDTPMIIDLIANHSEVNIANANVTTVTSADGVVVINNLPGTDLDGTITFIPNADFNGIATVNYTIYC